MSHSLKAPRHIEPYDISVEDFDRPDIIPDDWLRFGSYYLPPIKDCESGAGANKRSEVEQMKFLKKIKSLLRAYPTERCGRKDCANLYGLYAETPPLAEHIVFDPMSRDIKRSLQRCYKKEFPKSLFRLYDYMNGLSMFWSKIPIGKNEIIVPISAFEIYGVPLTYDRRHTEPYDISVEDFDRPDIIPDDWLRFGSYYLPPIKGAVLRDLYLDTCSERVLALEHREDDNLCILQEWETLDECLCEILDTLLAGDIIKPHL